ncbi:MAG TPA: hypothetical protein VMD25_12175 [Acidobacteriaceae bacterium]|nr:hypothetical protein [Acidobacteriaceae bacterium]
MALASPAPVFFTRERRQSLLRAVPVYWHFLSLDAPTVAVLWAWSFTRAVAATVSWSAIAVLGLGTWLLYVGDRLLDSRLGASGADLRERHFFHARHRRALLICGALSIAPLIWLIVFRMPAAARGEDVWIFAVAMAYFAAVHQPKIRVRFPHELAVAPVFAAATVVPAWAGSTAAHVDLLWLAALFAALCWLNCACIHAWESAKPPRRWSFASTLALLIACITAALMVPAAHESGVFRLLAAMLASALLLFALDRDFSRSRRRAAADRGDLSTLALRILADTALLTPLMLTIPWRV